MSSKARVRRATSSRRVRFNRIIRIYIPLYNHITVYICDNGYYSNFRQKTPFTQVGHAAYGFNSIESHHNHSNGHWHLESEGRQCPRTGLPVVPGFGWFGHFPIVQEGKKVFSYKYSLYL